MVLLSEQAVVDCSHACSNVTGYGPVCNQGCNGGWPWAAMADVKVWGGLPTEKEYPYTAETGTCSIKGKQLYAPLSNVTCISGPALANEADMAAWLATHGPLSIALNADPLQEYNGGILDPKHGCNPKQLDHAVLLVGYGAEGGKNFWKVKNSWGGDWGEKGYFRIARGSGTCGINAAVSTVFL
jgi:cathepsin F